MSKVKVRVGDYVYLHNWKSPHFYAGRIRKIKNRQIIVDRVGNDPDVGVEWIWTDLYTSSSFRLMSRAQATLYVLTGYDPNNYPDQVMEEPS